MLLECELTWNTWHQGQQSFQAVSWNKKKKAREERMLQKIRLSRSHKWHRGVEQTRAETNCLPDAGSAARGSHPQLGVVAPALECSASEMSYAIWG